MFWRGGTGWPLIDRVEVQGVSKSVSKNRRRVRCVGLCVIGQEPTTFGDGLAEAAGLNDVIQGLDEAEERLRRVHPKRGGW